jgi:hypothetical protein
VRLVRACTGVGGSDAPLPGEGNWWKCEVVHGYYCARAQLLLSSRADIVSGDGDAELVEFLICKASRETRDGSKYGGYL